jgi:hypothetical protein
MNAKDTALLIQVTMDRTSGIELQNPVAQAHRAFAIASLKSAKAHLETASKLEGEQ